MAKVKNNNNKNNKSKKLPILYLVAGLLIVVVIATSFLKNGNDTKQTADGKTETTTAEVSENGDLIIPVAAVSDKASFYEYDVDGTKLEVMAIKASDGTIRTAFNTCQVCYSSGRGYYEQDGDALICQNCGNRFSADDVEVTRGGCNPVPIPEENKTTDDTNIIISQDYLKSAKELFENWKL
ncbi:DUF2318 domain-containing protein [Konateibacter massiliensis]|uniref:DUF2318 domain-containing protein n=1 Tax=Konateibacter massiliensis TaxID=2002841 RepID=UPI000C144F56|nr:DUF2318 domain-containing protein [Konateibacter massiliensis]